MATSLNPRPSIQPLTGKQWPDLKSVQNIHTVFQGWKAVLQNAPEWRNDFQSVQVAHSIVDFIQCHVTPEYL